MKKLLCILLTSVILMAAMGIPSFSAQTTPQGDFSVLVNGEYVSFSDDVPLIQDGQPYVPLVTLLRRLGFEGRNIAWNSQTATTAASKGDFSFSLTIGQREVTATRAQRTTTLLADTPPLLLSGRT